MSKIKYNDGYRIIAALIMLIAFVLCVSACGDSEMMYSIERKSTSGGSYTVSSESATAGTIISITITPNKGYNIKSVIVKTSNGKTVTLSGEGKKRTFTMPKSDVSVSVTFKLIPTSNTTAVTTTTRPANPMTTSTTGNVYQGSAESITINDADLEFSGTLRVRKSTTRIILHHAASSNDGNYTVQDIHHQQQVENGWAGIGYHFYVRKDGTIWIGRPINTVGAHAAKNNDDSIGICFEGNFETADMAQDQLNAGINLIAYVQREYGGNLTILKHSDVNSTSCPGKYFPWDQMVH